MAPTKTLLSQEVSGDPLMRNNGLSNSMQNGCAMPGNEKGGALGEAMDTQCGVGTWRPDCLQPFAKMRYFTAVLSLVNIFGNMNYSYYTAVITQIEKCFGLSSSMTGFIKNVDNIGAMACVLLVAHFGRYANKPRLFAVATLGTAVAIFMFALPYFIYGSGDVTSLQLPNTSASVKPYQLYELCDGDSQDDDKCSSGGNSNLATFSTGAFALFILSELLQGIAQSPTFSLSVTYMDDNTKKSSAKHIGVMMGMKAFAPIMGFLLGAWATSIYVNLSDPDLDQRDPRWVGAWWLGFVICGLASLIPVLPLMFFPRRIKGAEQEADRQGNDEYEQDKEEMKKLEDLPRAIFRLIKNPLLMMICLGACFSVFNSGFGTFTPKYLEQQFHLTASMASILTGVVAVISWSVGPILSGGLVSRFSMTPSTSLRFMFICNMVGACCFAVLMFIGCPTSEWAGTITLKNQDVMLSCNTNCSCDPTEYIPVCGSDGLNYFSPCLAGCQDWHNVHNTTEKVFTGCGCIAGGTATSGLCAPKCNMLIPYMTIQSLSLFVASLTFVPIMSTVLRISGKKDKALSIAFLDFALQIVSFPAPMVFGWVIDTACLVTQTSCDRKGACLLYDITDVRYKLHAFASGLKLGAALCFALCWYLARHQTEPLLNNKTTEKPVEPKPNVKNIEEETDLLKETNV